MISKNQTVEIKVLDEATGIVEAYVNSMGVVDSDNDVIAPSAFNRSIDSNLPVPVLSGHDQHTIVGKVVTARPIMTADDTWKLFAVMKMNLETQDGRDAFSNVKGDFVREWSVGFNIPDGAWDVEDRDGTPVRIIKDLDWVEVSTVIRGASPDTATVAAKEAADNSEEPIVEDVASGTVDEAAPDTTLQQGKLTLLRTQLELKKGKKPKKKPRY